MAYDFYRKQIASYVSNASGHNTQPWKFRIADNAIMIEDILFYQIEKRQTNRSYRIRLKNVLT
ncbi:hypothetical protein DW973_14750 [Parabacteroides merdae]|nr:hypothetical protein DW973_14750 [Parabacteroides merdae]